MIICTCQDAHLLYLAGLTNASLRKRRNWLKLDIERRLESAGLELRGTIDGCNAPHFTHLFIDEAAQATEPSTLIPLQLGLARLKQVDGSGAAADADLATSQLRGSASLPPC